MRTCRPAQEAGAGDPDILAQAMLRKYITYAKQTCRPKLQNADYDKIATVRAARQGCTYPAALSGFCEVFISEACGQLVAGADSLPSHRAGMLAARDSEAQLSSRATG